MRLLMVLLMLVVLLGLAKAVDVTDFADGSQATPKQVKEMLTQYTMHDLASTEKQQQVVGEVAASLPHKGHHKDIGTDLRAALRSSGYDIDFFEEQGASEGEGDGPSELGNAPSEGGVAAPKPQLTDAGTGLTQDDTKMVEGVLGGAVSPRQKVVKVGFKHSIFGYGKQGDLKVVCYVPN